MTTTPVTAALQRLGIDYRVLVHPQPVYTAEDAAAARGVALSQVTKAMIVTAEGGGWWCVLIPGHRRLDLSQVAETLSRSGARLAKPREVERVTGYRVGAISPLGLLEKEIHFLLDRAVLAQEWITISAGTPEAGILLRSRDLLRALNPTLGTFTESSTPHEPC